MDLKRRLMAQPFWGSSARIFRSRRSSVPWTRSVGLLINRCSRSRRGRRFLFPFRNVDAPHEQPDGQRHARGNERQKKEIGCVCRRQDQREVLRDEPETAKGQQG